MKLVTEIKMRPVYTDENLRDEIAKRLDIKVSDILGYEIIKRGIDARHKPNIYYILNVAVNVGNKTNKKIKCLEDIIPDHSGLVYKKVNTNFPNPVIVGFGPSGIFCALALARAGLKPIVLEQGKCVAQRQIDVEDFWNNRKLNFHSNVQFGEGGAGTFSDGKLNTNLNNSYCKKIINEFISHGAPSEIYYQNKPHIGTDNLKVVVTKLRQEIENLGGKVIFNAKFCDFCVNNGKISSISYLDLLKNVVKTIETNHLILAVGHSAKEVFVKLKDKNIAMRKKPFAVGVRIEHPQELIDIFQYGGPRGVLPPADYKVAVHLNSGRSVFSFCMCPGGSVVASSSNEGTIVTNGMSNYKRDGKYANSALLVGVNPEDFGGDDVLEGFDFQRQIEQKAFNLGGCNYNAPAENLYDFLEDCASGNMSECSYIPGITTCDLREVFPKFIYDSLKDGIKLIDKKIKGFADPNAMLIAPETRSSCPVQMIRGEDYTCTFLGLYACGEGAGYAGGIISSAVDGVKCAEKIMQIASM